MKELIKKYNDMPAQIKASLWFFLCTFLQKGILIITTPIFTRILTPAEYGKISVFDSWMGVISVVITLNLFYGLYMQGLVKFEKEKSEFSSSMQGLTTVFCVAWAVIYFAFSNFFNALFGLTTPQMTLMLLLIWASAIFSFWLAEQRIKMDYKALVTATITVSLLDPIISVLLVLNSEDKVTAKIIGMTVIRVIVYGFIFVKKINKDKHFYSKKFWRYGIAFGIPLIPHYLATTILNSVDRIMIDSIVDSASAGIYSLSYSIAMIMLIFNGAVLQSVEPWIYKTIKKGNVHDISKLVYPLLILVAFCNVLLIMFAPEALAIFASDTYAEALWLIPPIAMSVYFIFAFQMFAPFEFYYEKRLYIVISTSVAAVLNIVLNYILLQIFSYQAAAYTTLLCYIVYALCHYLFMRKICKTQLDNVKVFSTKKLVLISTVFMTTGFATMLTYYNIWLRYSVILATLVMILMFRLKIIAYLTGLKKSFEI